MPVATSFVERRLDMNSVRALANMSSSFQALHFEVRRGVIAVMIAGRHVRGRVGNYRKSVCERGTMAIITGRRGIERGFSRACSVCPGDQALRTVLRPHW